MSSALKQAVEIATTLDQDERDQLKRYLASRPTTVRKNSGDAEKWAEFWRLGDEIASQLKPGESPSRILNEMRR